MNMVGDGLARRCLLVIDPDKGEEVDGLPSVDTTGISLFPRFDLFWGYALEASISLSTSLVSPVVEDAVVGSIVYAYIYRPGVR